MNDVILAHSAAETSSPLLPMAVMGLGLLIPLLVITLCVLWPSPRHHRRGPKATLASTSMYEELWELVDAVEHQRFTRADLKREAQDRVAGGAGRC